jgi:signal peptidase II
MDANPQASAPHGAPPSPDQTASDDSPGLDRPSSDLRAGLFRLAIALGVGAVVVVIDVVSKSWALHRLASGPMHVVWRLDFDLSLNSGSAFSLFTGQTVLITGVALVLVAMLLVMVWRAPSAGRAAIVGLIMGGALGNLGDRLFRGEHGAVVDFIAFHFWPTFNVADSCIVVGCGLLVVSLLRTGSPR